MKLSSCAILIAVALAAGCTGSRPAVVLTDEASGDMQPQIILDDHERVAFLVIPIDERKLTAGRVLAEGRDVFGVTFEDLNDRLSDNNWTMSIDIPDSRGEIDYGDLLGVRRDFVVNPPYQRAPFPFGLNLNEAERVVHRELRRAVHLSTFYPVTYDGNCIIMGSIDGENMLWSYLVAHRPERGRVFLRYADGTEISQMVRVTVRSGELQAVRTSSASTEWSDAHRAARDSQY